MGFLGKVFKGIGHAISSVASGIGHAVGSIAKGVGKFLQSPIGKLVMNVGLGFLTGGASSIFSGILGGGLGNLLGGGLANLLSGGVGNLLQGGLGNLLGGGGLSNLFSGFASNFLSNPSSLLSGSGLSSLLGFGQNAQGSGGLLDMVGSLFKAQQSSPPQTDGSQEGAQINLQQMVAYLQAQQLLTQLQGMMQAPQATTNV